MSDYSDLTKNIVTAMADDIRREIDEQIMEELMRNIKQQQINYPRYPQLFMSMHK